jgi:small subunit ribosomal protein S6
MAIYETIYILDSLMPPKDIDTTIQRYSGIITDNGGTVRKVDKWGKRRLAYEIQKKQYGFYVSIEFEGPGNIPKLLESDYNYNDKVLRYLTYRYDKYKLKAMEKEQVQKPSSVPTESEEDLKPAAPVEIEEEVLAVNEDEPAELKQDDENFEEGVADDVDTDENAEEDKES